MNTTQANEPAQRSTSNRPTFHRDDGGLPQQRPLQIIELTCSHCGATGRFAREHLLPLNLAEFEAHRCNSCGEIGFAVVIASYLSLIAPSSDPLREAEPS